MAIKNIIKLSVLYCDEKGLSESRLSTLIFGGGMRLSQLRSGASTVTLKTYNRVIQWFSDHWPKDLSWPVDIPRPAVQGKRVKKRRAA